MRFFRADESDASQPALLFELWRRGDWIRRPVAGESFHEKEIRALLPRTMGTESVEIQEQALLVPEPTNRHDRNAVKVMIRGQHVGYLPKEDAPLYQPLLLKLASQGLQPVVSARIWANQYNEWKGTDRRGRDVFEPRLNVDITLGLDEPHMCVPSNLPPAAAHALLPYGNALQVKGEEQFQDVLARYLHPEGEQWAYATLAVVDRQSARTSKQVVEVVLDGSVVGELTPAMSAEFSPIIQRLEAAGKACAAQVIVKGNALKADVVLHAAKASALESDWLAKNLKPSPTVHPAPIAATGAAAQVSTPGAPQVSQAASAHSPIPPRPTRIIFQVPASWPQPPDGWEPPPGWQPPAEWPPAPAGWEFWKLA